MVFQGDVLTVAALIDAAQTTPAPLPGAKVGVRHTAASNARDCAQLLSSGDSVEEGWRFGILQTLDDYTSTLRRGGPDLAAGVFADEPPHTGAVEIDAAFAALAEYLAVRDGWEIPAWAQDLARRTTAWYPSVPKIFRTCADAETPDEFRKRGIFITARSLERA